MVLLKVSVIVLLTMILNKCLCSPGHHHVHHRIHVPTKIKTIYHTKIIKVKVPEHHHYITEKEKPHLVKVPEHHHYFHEKEKEKSAEVYDFHHKEDEGDFQDDFQGEYENEQKDYGHHIFKKHAQLQRRYKKRKHRH